jgi:methylenetetrahydrofolate dehydrogenase (NADP+)/methenyltetrahydrofolate cyclohydrolase
LSLTDDRGAQSYIRSIRKSCEKCSVDFVDQNFRSDDSNDELKRRIEHLSSDEEVHGVILQWPLPGRFDPAELFGAISVEKDVDGMSPISTMRLVMGQPNFVPCTARAVIEILVRSGVRLEGEEVVIVGRSPTVGKPLALALLIKDPGLNSTVTVCHTGTQNLTELTSSARVLVVAAGSPGLVYGDMVKKDAVVIDVGINVVDDPESGKKRIVGDVDFESVSRIAGAITPVPGGVGPVTTAILSSNVVIAAERLTRDAV